MNKVSIVVIMCLLGSGFLTGQVAELNWELDYEIFMKMANDSNYTYDIREVFHVTDIKQTHFSSEFVFYPVNPGEEYISSLDKAVSENESFNTLWSALNAKLGGGWIHFINCIAYSLEMKVLNLQEPILMRPVTNWKPDPITDSWKRTRKWQYYIPYSQKNAQKEYKIKLHGGTAGDLNNLPTNYIDQFLATSNKKFNDLKKEDKNKQLAEINLVKVILGANYLGEEQINYISNAVITAVKSYAQRKLPSVLIFDEFDAAAAMSLDAEGYKLESIVFRSSAQLETHEMEKRRIEIEGIIQTINDYNNASFQKRLNTYYKN